MIAVEIEGDRELVARLETMPQRLHDRLVTLMNKLGIDLTARVVAKLSGAVLKRRTGRLAQAQNWRVEDQAQSVAAAVGFNTRTVPYGAIHEFGGTTRAHLIEARNAKALAFVVGGRQVFAKRVNHPGSRIPERSFLRSALREIAPEAVAAIEGAVAEAVAP